MSHRHGSHLVDGDLTERNHNYMSTRQEDSEVATAAGTGPGEDAIGDDAGDDTAPDRSPGAAAKVRAWFAVRLPADWFTAAPDIQVDREEITIVGALADPAAAGDSDAERAAVAADRIRAFREDTRSRRVEIAREAEHRFRRKVSWGVACGPVSEMFTTLSVPVMTRLRQSERRVLDTLGRRRRGPQPQRRAGLVRPAHRRERGRVAVPAPCRAAPRRGGAGPGSRK